MGRPRFFCAHEVEPEKLFSDCGARIETPEITTIFTPHMDDNRSRVIGYGDCSKAGEFCEPESASITFNNGRYHVVLPANLSAKIPNPSNRAAVVSHGQGAVWWISKKTYPKNTDWACPGPDGNQAWSEGGATFVEPHRRAAHWSTSLKMATRFSWSTGFVRIWSARLLIFAIRTKAVPSSLTLTSGGTQGLVPGQANRRWETRVRLLPFPPVWCEKVSAGSDARPPKYRNNKGDAFSHQL